MTDKQKPDPDKLARGTAFMAAVLDAAKLYSIPPKIIFAIFGRIGKTAIAASVEDGISEPDATIAVISAFMKGLGIEVMRD